MVYLAHGITLLLLPELVTHLNVDLASPSARTEVRAFYGGLEIGLALFFAMGAFKRTWLRPSLFAQIVSLGGLALGRLFGMMVDGSSLSLHYVLFTAELTGTTLGAIAWMRLRAMPEDRETNDLSDSTYHRQQRKTMLP